MSAANEGRGVPRLREEEGEEVLRPLATYERFRVTLHDEGFHYNVSLAGIYSPAAGHSDARPPVRVAILSSVRRAVLGHQCLSLQLRCDENGAPCFIRLRQVNVTEAVEFRRGQAEDVRDGGSVSKLIESTLSAQNSTGFWDPNRPLWRIVVLSLQGPETGGGTATHGSIAVIFVYHHVIADGMSGLAMHNSILNGLNSQEYPEAGEAGEEESAFAVTPTPASLLPTMDELIPYETTWKAWITSRFRSWAPCLQKDFRLKSWAGAPHSIEGSSPSNSTKTNIRLIRLTVEETARIQERCRVEQVSVTALLQILVGAVLFEAYPDAGVVRCATAISLRRFFPPERGITSAEMGLWIDGFRNTFTRKELLGKADHASDVPWKYVRRSKQHVEAEIRKGLLDLGFASLRSVPDFREMLGRTIGRERANSYSIVSVGIFERIFPEHRDPSHNGWTLEGMVVSQSAHVNGSAIQFCTVATEQGGMTVSAGWQDGIVSEDDADLIVKGLREKLQNMSL